MSKKLLAALAQQTETLREDGLFKAERIITSPQNAAIRVQTPVGEKEVLNFCANNYLGLADHPEVIKAAHGALDVHGFGMASVRFICGTQDVHKELEAKLSSFLNTEETLLYPSCFDANGGLFETLLGEEDAIISDALNHASIIDGVRLCKAQRFRYANNDMNDLEAQLKCAQNARYRMIATDGVFSMDGVIASLDKICALAEKYDALVMVDDCHATGFIGPNGRGTPELYNVQARVDLLTGTLGKALGGASGGYTSGRRELVGWLRQRSRPYLFSNAVAPVIAGASLTVLDMLTRRNEFLQRIHDNAAHFRQQMAALGFTLLGAGHPIIPVLLGDAKLATEFADRMLTRGIYVVGFSFPVVPKDQARIRTQMSAAHTRAQLEQAIVAFAEVGRELGVISNQRAKHA